ncbi:MAG: hypothetical protein GX929_09735 [Clostridiales bacterium]|nr:hypothetical protein [Clostridiales bacterium]
MTNTTITAMTPNPDEQRMLARVLDCAEICRSRSVPTRTLFLTPRERELAGKLTPDALFVPKGSERTAAVFLPCWADDAWTYAELTYLRITRKDREDAPSHRDYLGSLLGLGLKRETIGDLWVREDGCDLCVTRIAADFLIQTLERVGRHPVTCTEIAPVEVIRPEAAYKEIRDTVATLRLDSVVSSGFSIARGKAADAVKAGRVAVNGTECDKPDRLLAEGDTVSVRGLGKCVLRSVGGLSKKGRVTVILRRFI